MSVMRFILLHPNTKFEVRIGLSVWKTYIGLLICGNVVKRSGDLDL